MTPDKFTNSEFFLDVGDGHQLYVHDWGNPKAKKPIIFLHGGPGSGVKDRYKQQFVPERQRVIFFDQRGSGKSLPKGSLEHNTTNDLVEDIERLVNHLKLSSFIITGGSWGSLLALVYAIKYPEKISSMVLRGIFTGRKTEIEYLDKGGFRQFFPEVWEHYVESVPRKWQNDPSAYHYPRALGSDVEKAKASAYAYAQVEGPLLQLDDRYTPTPYEEFDPDSMCIEMHYLANYCFLPEDYVIKNASKLSMPIWLVQGRYDVVCPPTTAYELHNKLPNSELIWTVAGHGNDRPNYDVIRTLLLQLSA